MLVGILSFFLRRTIRFSANSISADSSITCRPLSLVARITKELSEWLMPCLFARAIKAVARMVAAEAAIPTAQAVNWGITDSYRLIFSCFFNFQISDTLNK